MNKLNALSGQGLAQSEIDQAAISAPTMSSLEMVDYINANRKAKAESEGLLFPCKKYRKLEHRSFMKKVPKVLGDAAAKFFATDTYINGTGGVVERDICNFPKREACLMAMSYDYELQAQIFDYMTELERNINGDLVYTIQQMENIVSSARKASDEDSSDAGRRLRQRQDDLPLLDKAEKLVKDFRQFSFELIGGGKVGVSE
ncbi:Rha family transcriptional regulator [Citrobacter freundii]|uniref:Rha family transcriptional regulator n=1 Tax=Citrobacter freundii TaxID=546 RepID=A0AAN4A5M3_CITFR|nr:MULTISPECIES: Rha family transcriptional regulator [Citrobacter]HEM7418486.1 Rha family transcriptional regulator [Citrobacter youngae]EKV4647107.1 Rha family transcriptional regulator [Citrobacter freundii]EKW7208883.1 Rha family transcriptional regulator [Citrobacter freundii]ELO0986037.1 Rha family transcriptional regulator [Citrobacter freundii]ELV3679413.1 Rha family transcriptional regulator [Citrobacter freundii]